MPSGPERISTSICACEPYIAAESNDGDLPHFGNVGNGCPYVMSRHRFGTGAIWCHNHYPEQDITTVTSMSVHDDFLGPLHHGSPKSVLPADDYAAASDWTTRRVSVHAG